MTHARAYFALLVQHYDRPPAPAEVHPELDAALALRDEDGQRVRRFIGRWCPHGREYEVRG